MLGERAESLNLFLVSHESLCDFQNGKGQSRGRINLIGRLQLSSETNVQEEHDDIIALRILRVQEAIVKVLFQDLCNFNILI